MAAPSCLLTPTITIFAGPSLSFIAWLNQLLPMSTLFLFQVRSIFLLEKRFVVTANFYLDSISWRYSYYSCRGVTSKYVFKYLIQEVYLPIQNIYKLLLNHSGRVYYRLLYDAEMCLCHSYPNLIHKIA